MYSAFYSTNTQSNNQDLTYSKVTYLLTLSLFLMFTQFELQS